MLAAIRFLFFVSVTPGAPSSVTTHSVFEWAALISTTLPIKAGFHADTTLAKSPGLHRSPLALILRSILALILLPKLLYICTVV
ncbi:hypothetical protein WL66_05455 [Burkholderia ubonensis]|nr:hypothetical protein WL66_05455 [Burkholderia ubonensis]